MTVWPCSPSLPQRPTICIRIKKKKRESTVQFRCFQLWWRSIILFVGQDSYRGVVFWLFSQQQQRYCNTHTKTPTWRVKLPWELNVHGKEWMDGEVAGGRSVSQRRMWVTFTLSYMEMCRGSGEVCVCGGGGSQGSLNKRDKSPKSVAVGRWTSEKHNNTTHHFYHSYHAPNMLNGCRESAE